MKYFHFLWFTLLIALPSFSQQGIKVACIGNSVTRGYLLKNPLQTAYPAVLQNLLGERYTVKNFGHSGATLLRDGHNPYYKTNEFKDALAFAPDIAVIHLGLNDTDPRNWPQYGDAFMADYTWLIDTLRSTNPALQVFICRMTPIFSDHPRFKSGTRDWFWQIQAQITSVAKANQTELIDLHTPLYARPDLFPDALHPNAEGASILAHTVYASLTGDHGGLALDPVFGSHMVLQRDRPVLIYGTANRDERISVRFMDQKRTVIPRKDGKWTAEFPAQKAGGPYQIIVEAADTSIVISDVLVGDVWLCSGQSNMAFPMKSAFNSKMDIEMSGGNQTIRLRNMKPLAETDNVAWDSATLERINALDHFSGNWEKCEPKTSQEFSAVAYYFGLNLNKKLKVPIGLIQVAVGGSPAESWIDRYTMEHDPVLVNELTNWRRSDFLMPWVRERADVNLQNSANPKQRHPYEPCYNFESGIRHLTTFPIRGIIWYQGESNAHNVDLYDYMMPVLVNSWRKNWDRDLPFYYVQLSGINRPSWPEFRHHQRQLLKKIPNSGMAVSSDLGDPVNVHPTHKKEIGDRLSRLALHFTYNHKEVVPYGPVAVKAKRQNEKIILTFEYVAGGLKTSDHSALRGFSVRDNRGIVRDVKAFIQKDQVIIPVSKSDQIVSVLYGWKPFTDANLVNLDLLPASTFKLEVN